MQLQIRLGNETQTEGYHEYLNSEFEHIFENQWPRLPLNQNLGRLKGNDGHEHAVVLIY